MPKPEVRRNVAITDRVIAAIRPLIERGEVPIDFDAVRERVLVEMGIGPIDEAEAFFDGLADAAVRGGFITQPEIDALMIEEADFIEPEQSE